VAPFVCRAVQSIIDQTYKNLEIWIIDDASTDDTLQKINSFEDQRITVIVLKENTQKIGAVNEVLQKVNGDYIAFQDSDDWSEPNRIEEQLKEFFKEDQLGICFTNYRCIGSQTFLPEKTSLTNEELRNEFFNFYKKDTIRQPTVCGTMMISRAALQQTTGYNPYFTGRVAEDIQWVYRILKDFKGVTIDKSLYNYRSRRDSFTQIQSTGTNAKYAYSWQLLSKIIHQDVYEGVDVLTIENKELLHKLELEACEAALVKTTQLLNETRLLYENSTSYKLGKLLLTPFRFIKTLLAK